MITTTGAPGVEITTWVDSVETHPTAFVTLKVYTPPVRSVMVLLVPEPETVTPPGERVITHEPVEGSPVNITLPVGTARVGCVIAPITGAVGVNG